jgi:hypothetical protein
MDKKINTGLFFLDKLMENGIPTGNLTVLTGESKTGNYLARFIPVALEKGYRVMFNLEQSEAITKHGQCIMDKMLKKMQEEGFDTSKIQRTKTISEKIGDTWFPVTYHEDGMVTVDYPTRLFCEQVKENKNGKQS